jgi:hypothetical protein
MRYFLAAIFVCAIGAPVASALPAPAPGALSVSNEDSILQVAKRGGGKPQAAKKSKSGGNSSSSGIHPLVGSGDY